MQTPQKRPLSISQNGAHAQHAIGIERIPVSTASTSRDACCFAVRRCVPRCSFLYACNSPAGLDMGPQKLIIFGISNRPNGAIYFTRRQTTKSGSRSTETTGGHVL
jgi:hypothetical protein